MRSIKRFILPVDFSEASKAALTYAAHLSKDFGDRGVECLLIHIVDDATPDLEIADLKQKLKEFSGEFLDPANVKHTQRVLKGNLPAEIVIAKKELKGDIVIMGTDGSNTESHHTADLIEALDGTVITVPAGNKTNEIKKIALAIDTQKIDDPNRLSILNDFAKWFKAKIHLVLVSNDQNTDHSIHDELLEYYLETIEFSHHVIIDTEIEAGILGYLKDQSIDVLAILPRTHAQQMTPSDGKLTRALVLDSKQPILVLD